MGPSGAKGCGTLKNHKAGSIFKKFQEVASLHRNRLVDRGRGASSFGQGGFD
jgi:hypothetical protein